MNAKLSRRVLAFLMDVLIITSMFFLLNILIPKNHNVDVLESEITDVRSQYLKGSIDLSIYMNRYATIEKSLDQETIPNNILNIILILGYFVLVPYYWDGKTIGKRIMKIKIIKEEKKESITLNDYLLRSLITTGMFCFLISMCTVFLANDIQYFTITIISVIIQVLLVIISGFMIIYRHDKKGVQDLISGTLVVIDEKK